MSVPMLPRWTQQHDKDWFAHRFTHSHLISHFRWPQKALVNLIWGFRQTYSFLWWKKNHRFSPFCWNQASSDDGRRFPLGEIWSSAARVALSGYLSESGRALLLCIWGRQPYKLFCKSSYFPRRVTSWDACVMTESIRIIVHHDSEAVTHCVTLSRAKWAQMKWAEMSTIKGLPKWQIEWMPA